MSILPVVNQVIMLCLVAGIGLMMRCKKIFTDSVIQSMNYTIIWITAPCMILMMTQRTYDPLVLQNFFLVMGLSAAAMALGLVLAAWALRREPRARRGTLAILAAMPNAGYVGLPIIEAAYGEMGTLYLAGYIAAFMIVVWTVGVAVFNGFSLRTLKGLLNPSLIASILGILFFVTQIELPAPLLSTVKQLGAMTTPLSMLMLGSRMDTLRPRQLADRPLMLSVAARLLIFPLAVWLALRPMNLDPVVNGVLVLSSAMPAACIVQQFSERFDGDIPCAAASISVTTLLSLVTIPLVALVTGL